MPSVAPQSSSMESPESVSFPPIFRSHIDNCQFGEWYPKYNRLTPEAKIIKDLPQEFIDYLLSDGIILPPDESDNEDEGVTAAELDARPGGRIRELDSNINANLDTVFDDSDDEDAPADPSLKFKALHREIRKAISDLGGSVIPKLNWSSPKDAVWMSLTNSLKCTTPSEIYLLFKSSSFITHDLTEPYSGTVEATTSENGSVDPPASYTLVLRKNFNLNPSLEFRCFVKSRVLVGISQRDHLNHYTYLGELKDSLGYEIEEFFENYLQDSFPDDSFVFDVFVPEPYDRVFLIDINPWAPTTDPLLFTWYELLSITDEELRPDRYRNRVSSSPGSPLPLDESNDSDTHFSIPIPIRNNGSRSSLTSRSTGRNNSIESLSSMRLLDLNSTSRVTGSTITSIHDYSTNNQELSCNSSHPSSTVVSINNSPIISEISSDAELYEYEFRLVAKEQGSNDLLGGRVQHSENRVPKDIVDASMTGQGIAEIAKHWSMLMNGEIDQDDESSDESD